MNRFIASLKEGFKIALSSIWTNKTRAMLTTTCIVIGIVSVTAMNTISDGIDRTFEESMDMLGRNVVYVSKWPWGFGGEYKWWEYRNRREMEFRHVDELRNLIPSASQISGSVSRSTSVRYQDRTVENGTIHGATASYFDTAGLGIESGRAFSDADEQRSAKVVVIGSGIADALFPDVDPLGKQVRIRGQRFLVVGTLETAGNFLGMSSQDNQMVVPSTAMMSIFDVRSGVELAIQFFDEDQLVDGEYEVIGAMRQIRGLDPMDDDDFAINKAALFEQEFQ